MNLPVIAIGVLCCMIGIGFMSDGSLGLFILIFGIFVTIVGVVSEKEQYIPPMAEDDDQELIEEELLFIHDD